MFDEINGYWNKDNSRWFRWNIKNQFLFTLVFKWTKIVVLSGSSTLRHFWILYKSVSKSNNQIDSRSIQIIIRGATKIVVGYLHLLFKWTKIVVLSGGSTLRHFWILYKSVSKSNNQIDSRSIQIIIRGATNTETETIVVGFIQLILFEGDISPLSQVPIYIGV